MAGVKNWFPVECCGNAPHIHSDKPRHMEPWQHSQQQNVKRSASSAVNWGPGPQLPASRSSSMSRSTSSQGSYVFFCTLLSGCLGAMNSISPSPTIVLLPSSGSLSKYWTLNLSERVSISSFRQQGPTWAFSIPNPANIYGRIPQSQKPAPVRIVISVTFDFQFFTPIPHPIC